MSDGNSCSIFSDVLSILAENPTKENKQLAKRIYELTHRYDFCPEDMGINNECIDLGVARSRKGCVVWIDENRF